MTPERLDELADLAAAGNRVDMIHGMKDHELQWVFAAARECNTLKAENEALRELLELAYDWVPQTDKPLRSKIESALAKTDPKDDS